MPAVTQDRETQKKIISEYLKAADRYIKSSEFPKALDEVKKALGVEPNNMYAMAYNERIKVAMEAARKKEEEEHFKKQAEEQKKACRQPLPGRERARRKTSIPSSSNTASSIAAQLPGDDMITKIKKEASEAAEKKTDARIDLLKQEFAASQQKFQEDIARLTRTSAAKGSKRKLASFSAERDCQLGRLESIDCSSRKIIPEAWETSSLPTNGALDGCKERRGNIGPGFCKNGERKRLVIIYRPSS